MANKKNSASRPVRKVLLFAALSLLFVVAVPLIPYVIQANAADVNSDNGSAVALQNPAINLWNDVRQRFGATEGTTQVKGVDSEVLINKAGEDWRKFRLEMLVPYGAYLMLAIMGAIIVFYVSRGKIRLPGGRTGKRIPRMTVNQRTAHWFTASLFWLLAVTGLILLYGKFVLIPLLGAEGFSITATVCKQVHNYSGPVFLLAVLAMFILFVRHNVYNFEDLKWILKGGGMFGGHVSAGRYNAGEKTWFWLVMVFGIILSISGLILDFAVFGQGRQVMTVAHIFHGVSALILISISFGHIFLGTVGVEGTLESMTRGSVDAAWAKAHHDHWYEEMAAAGKVYEDTEGNDSSDIAQVAGVAKVDSGN